MFENFTRILGISLELQAFAIIGDIKKLLYMDQIQARSEDFKRGGGRDSEFYCVQRNEARIGSRVQGRGTMGNFQGGHKQGPRGRGCGGWGTGCTGWGTGMLDLGMGYAKIF